MPDSRRPRLGQRVRRLIAPDEPQDAAEIRALAEAQRKHARSVDAQLAALRRLIEQTSTAKDATEIFHAVRALTRGVEKALKAGKTAAGAEPDLDRWLYDALDEVAAGSRPILVGPWTGEVGFELIYWAPFVEWFRTRWRVPDERFVVVSRGGVESWYGMPGCRYVDIFSIVPPDRFRERTDQVEHKQRQESTFEQELLSTAARSLGLDDAAHLHPSLMYRALAAFWRDEAGFERVERFTRHRALTPPPGEAVGLDLPVRFLAVRFYFSDCFPDTPENRSAARSIIAAVSERMPVVLLNPGLRVDDHVDLGHQATDRVLTLTGTVSPERNLAVQSAVLSRASGYVGTYGGYSYLAPLYGVPAVAVYSRRTFKQHHLYVAQRVFERLGPATIIPIDTGSLDLVGGLGTPAS